MMRKLLPLFAMVLLVVIGCGGDDEEGDTAVTGPSKEDLVGSWEIVSIDGETPAEMAAEMAGEDDVEVTVTKKDYVFVADSSWYANLGFQLEGDLGGGLSLTVGMTFALKGKYTVDGSKLASVLEQVNVTLEPKDFWEEIGLTEEAAEQELSEGKFGVENGTWSLSGNTLTLTDDKGGKTVLRKQ